MKNFLKWGVFITAMNIVFMLIGYAAGISAEPAGRYLGWVSTIIGLGMLFWGIREKKQSDPGDFTFGRGWVEGVLISLVAGVMIAIFMYLFTEFINPEMIDAARAEAAKGMAAKDMPKEQLETAQKFTNFFISPTGFAISTLFMYGIGGMILSLIFSGIVNSMKGNAPQQENG